MFKDRTFNLSILFSSIWHLFWISSIGIVVTPGTQPASCYQEVNFLGPILEKTAFELMVEEVTPQAETLYAKTALFLDNVYLKPKGPERKVLKEFTPDVMRDRFTFSLREFIKDTKEIPLYFAEDVRISYRKTDNKAPLTSIEGPAGKKEIIFKPASLTVPRSLYGGHKEYMVKLKFFVSKSGVVHGIEPIVSSGYPEIDLKAIRFLRGWRFNPLSLAENEKSSAWGITKVRIEAK